MKAHETKPSLLVDLLIWVGLVLLILSNYALAHLDLGSWGVWIAVALASIEALLILIFYMELREQPGSRRFALPASLLFFFLLFGICLLDVGSRWLPTTPRWAGEVTPTEQRPAKTRTIRQNLTGPQTKRMPGQ